MRHLLLSLAAVLALTPLAQADQIDNFTISGNGNTFAFALPETLTVPNHPHVVYFEYFNVPGTVDGASGYSFFINFYSNPYLIEGRVATFDYGMGTDLTEVNFFGQTPVDPTASQFPLPPYSPYGSLTNTFVPGTYSLYTLDANYDRTRYTLTVTPGDAISTTPEPATLLLLGTGTLGLFHSLRRRRRI